MAIGGFHGVLAHFKTNLGHSNDTCIYSPRMTNWLYLGGGGHAGRPPI